MTENKIIQLTEKKCYTMNEAEDKPKADDYAEIKQNKKKQKEK